MTSSLASFDKVWMQSDDLGHRQDLVVKWNFTMPARGMIDWS
jgi:hypothetical protein